MTPSPPPAPVRYITTHSSDGKAVFDESTGSIPNFTVQDGAVVFYLAYAADNSPSSGKLVLSEEDDMQSYRNYSASPPGVVNPKGTVLRFVDMAPGNASPLHRTTSVDYAIVLVGEVELTLDSGEKRIVKPGEVVVQRGTSHAWRNTSEQEWARMLFAMVPCEKPVVNGEELGEWMEGTTSTRLS